LRLILTVYSSVQPVPNSKVKQIDESKKVNFRKNCSNNHVTSSTSQSSTSNDNTTSKVRLNIPLPVLSGE